MKPVLRVATLVVAFALSFASVASAAPLRLPSRVDDGFPSPGAPPVTAASWILFDESSDTVLASHLADEVRAMASTTKIMTGLLAVEAADLSDVVVVSQQAADTGEREIDLVAGEEITLEALVKAAMIHSANDAATAIAEHVGGTVEGFVEMMNDKAAELGLSNTRFANPHGLDAPGHHSTARDMLELARVAMGHQELRDIVRSRLVVFPQAPDGSIRVGTTTNLLLGEYEGAEGIKTGFTNQALLTFVATAERDGRRLYAVVLGSDGMRAHFADVTTLFDYGFGALGIYGTLSTGARYTSIKPRMTPGPLLVTAGTETLLHIAGQGLLSDPTALAREAAPIEPVPVRVTNRHPESVDEPVLGALRYWYEELFGD